ncbi:amidase family protein [Pseudopelagicola sp. nBUS_19]|uniref:amidase family protein n=1 Tax=Pseudopelagicola sp. nBUS_19 TaxID=3395316 RepID=UPI003EBDD756
MPVFNDISAVNIAEAVSAKTISATEITRVHLERIKAINPTINAIVQDCSSEAIAEAEALDARIANGEDPGPLAGVPITIKVNVDQARYPTTNGLRSMEKVIAEEDSPVVSNLRKAGAIIVGRSNTPAFSLRWFTKNDIHGQTLNPRNQEITPGGSSGGASAAVAAGLCAIGQGTDIAGSIRYPAYACGLHGLRPTIGRVPAFNASAPDRLIGAQLMAVSGPIARSIEDIQLSFRSMMVKDVRDPWHRSISYDSGPFEKRAALTLAPDGMKVCAEVRNALTSAAMHLEKNGWIVEETKCPPMRAAAEINAKLWMADMKLGAEKLLSLEGEVDSQFVYQQMVADAEPVDLENIMKALQMRISLIRQWEIFLQTWPLLICPVSGELPFDQQLDVKSEADFAKVFEMQMPQRALPALGLPALAVATGYANRRPVGVQLVSGHFREDLLLKAGATLEAAGHSPKVSDPFQLG